MTKYPVNLNRPQPAKSRPIGSEIGAEKNVLKMDQIETLSSKNDQGASQKSDSYSVGKFELKSQEDDEVLDLPKPYAPSQRKVQTDIRKNEEDNSLENKSPLTLEETDVFKKYKIVARTERDSHLAKTGPVPT